MTEYGVRGPSGRIGTTDAADQLRALRPLVEAGMELVEQTETGEWIPSDALTQKDAPESELALGGGDNQNTNREEGEPAMSNVTHTTNIDTTMFPVPDPTIQKPVRDGDGLKRLQMHFLFIAYRTVDGTPIPGYSWPDDLPDHHLVRGSIVDLEDGVTIVVGGRYYLDEIADGIAYFVLIDPLPCERFDWCAGHRLGFMDEEPDTLHTGPNQGLFVFDVEATEDEQFQESLLVSREFNETTGIESYAVTLTAEVSVTQQHARELGDQLMAAGAELVKWAVAQAEEVQA